MEFLDNVAESLYETFIITFAILTLPIWIVPYLIYKAMNL